MRVRGQLERYLVHMLPHGLKYFWPEITGADANHRDYGPAPRLSLPLTMTHPLIPFTRSSGLFYGQVLHSSQRTVGSRPPLHAPGQSGKPPGRIVPALPYRDYVEADLGSILALRHAYTPAQSLDCTNVACNDPPVPASV